VRSSSSFSQPVLAWVACSALGCGAMPAAANPAPRADMLEDIVITASRGKQRVFDSAATLSVITEQELDRAVVPSLAEMLRDVPGVQWLSESRSCAVPVRSCTALAP